MKGRAAWGTSDGGGNLVQDAVDYRGCRADKSSTGGWVAAALALGIELCERLSTMGIAVNLVTYLTDTMHLPQHHNTISPSDMTLKNIFIDKWSDAKENSQTICR